MSLFATRAAMVPAAVIPSLFFVTQVFAAAIPADLCPYYLGFARIDQASQAVKDAGLFADNGVTSNVCGPCALLAVSGKIRSQGANPIIAPVAELGAIMAESVPQTETTADAIRNGGVLSYDLATIARDHLVRRGVAAAVAQYGVEMDEDTTHSLAHFHRRTSILPQHFALAPGEHLLLNYETWSAADLDDYPPLDSRAGWLNGHWVTLLSLHGPDAAGYYNGTVLDPFRDRVSPIVMKTVISRYLGIATFVIYPGASSHLSGDKRGSRTTLVTNIIRIRAL